MSPILLSRLLPLLLLFLLFLLLLQLALLLSNLRQFVLIRHQLLAPSPLPCPEVPEIERESKRIVAEDGKSDLANLAGSDAQQGTDPEVFAEGGDEDWPPDLSLSHPLQCSCRFPLLRPTEPDLFPFVHHFRSVRCPPSPPDHIPLITQLRSGPLLFGLPHRSNLSSASSAVSCFVRELGGTLRPKVRRLQFLGNWTKIPIDKRVDVRWDQFVVKCFVRHSETASSRGTLVFHDAFANIVPRPAPSPASADPLLLSPDLPLGLSIFVIDSAARTQFLRHMPMTAQFLRDNQFRLMNGYTKIGDNSAINLLAVLAGMVFEPERRGFSREWFRANDSILSNEQIRDPGRDFFAPLRSSIVRLSEVGGYATLWNDEIATSGFGLFHYNAFKGFLQQPAQHYLRPYYEYLYQHLGASSGCVNGQFVAPRYIDIWERFASRYAASRPQLAFNFLTGLTHASANNIELLDSPLSEAMGRLKAMGHFRRNLVILMGDHGQRISEIQKTRTGRVEERMPLVAIGLPEAFERQWPRLARRLTENQNRLTSNFDLHQTLLHFLWLSANRTGNSVWMDEIRAAMESREGISMFDKIPAGRSCSDARVPAQFCCCMEQGEGEWPEGIEPLLLHSLLLSHLSNSSSLLPCLSPPLHLSISPAVVLFHLNPLARAGIRSPKMARERIAREGREWLKLARDEVLELELNGTLLVPGVHVHSAGTAGNGTAPLLANTLELYFLVQVGFHPQNKQLLIRGEPMLRGWKPRVLGDCDSGKELETEDGRGDDQGRKVIGMGSFCECLGRKLR